MPDQGNDGSTQFVAEVSSNHHRDLGRCFDFIDTAAEIGCTAVKFQLFRVKQLFAPEILTASEEHRRREAWELPTEFLPALADRCHASRLQFGCTPFYLDAVEELLPWVDFYKIASYELLWRELLVACARTGRPVVLSTGMATLEEVAAAVDCLRQAGCRQLTVLHCVSGYPTPTTECNLGVIETLRHSCGCPIGWSDHTVSPGVIYRAVHRWGATMVEFHLDLDGRGDEYRTGHCWLPDQIRSAIAQIRCGSMADGTGVKSPSPSELADRAWRADPTDGLRPTLRMREAWRQ